MFRSTLAATIIAAVAALTSLTAAEKDTLDSKTHAQTACPLTGKDINKEIFAVKDGKRVYFCCPQCRTAFENDPDKVLKKLAAEGVVLETVEQKQSLCPVMGGEINTTLYADYGGKRIYFCCEACKPAFAKDPAKYIRELEAKGIQLEKSPKGA